MHAGSESEDEDADNSRARIGTMNSGDVGDRADLESDIRDKQHETLCCTRDVTAYFTATRHSTKRARSP